MSGKVYTYNLFSEPAALAINGGAAVGPDGSTATGKIAANGGSGGSYAPASVTVGSAKHSDESSGLWYRGGDGVNTIRMTWDSGFSTSSTFKMPTVADDVSIDDELIVYIAKDKASVQTVTGIIKKDNELAFEATG